MVRLQALVCLLCFQLATAQGFRALRRDEHSISSPTVSLSSPQPSSQHSATKKPDDEHKQTDGPKEPTITKAPETTASAETTIQITTTSIAPKAPLNSSTLFNSENKSLYPTLMEPCADIERASNDPGRPSTNPTYHNSRMGCCRRHFDAHRSCLHPNRHQKSMD